MTSPAISVLMSVYNAQSDVKLAIESILQQSFTDFEFIIIDDGSTDTTPDHLEQAAKADPRIRIHKQSNTGLTKALNIGAAMARAPLIARQDADDFSYPLRLERQYAYMLAHPEIALLGTACDDQYADGTRMLWRGHDPAALQKLVFLQTPFAHSSVMMRTAILKNLGGYDEAFRTAQDMELWMRFAKAGPIAMLEEPLIRRSIQAGGISQKKRLQQTKDALRARLKHKGAAQPLILYHALRSLLIGLLPPHWIDTLKR